MNYKGTMIKNKGTNEEETKERIKDDKETYEVNKGMNITKGIDNENKGMDEGKQRN